MKKIRRNLNKKYQKVLTVIDHYIKYGNGIYTLIETCQSLNRLPKAVKAINQYFEYKPFAVYYEKQYGETFDDATIYRRWSNLRIDMSDTISYKNYKRHGKYIRFRIVVDCVSSSYQVQREAELRIYKDRYELIPLTKWDYVGVYTLGWAEME